MSPNLEKICNMAGYPMYNWAIDQLKVRSEKISKPVRNDEDIKYHGNRGAWIRLVSSVNLDISSIPWVNSFPGSPNFTDDKKTDFDYFKGLGIDIKSPEDLSKKFVLFGGTSDWTSGTKLKYGIAPNGAYNLLGDTSDFGYRPMPGITSATIESTGKMGSLRQATINIKVWTKNQLDIIDELYFRPGFTMLLEWGHNVYYDNSGNIQSSDRFMIDPFKASLTKEDVMLQISQGVQNSFGNYGGMLGIVTNFTFALNQEGGYDCVIKITALGITMADLKINKASVLTTMYEELFFDFVDREKEKRIEDAKDKANEERIKLEKQANDALKNSSDPNSLWGQLKITDPYKNILFNTHNIDPFSKQATVHTSDSGEHSSYVDVVSDIKYSDVSTSELSAALSSSNGPAKVSELVKSKGLDQKYYESKINPQVSGSNYILNSSSDLKIVAYYIPVPGNSVIYFGNNLSTNKLNVQGKYVTSENVTNQKGPTYVTLNIPPILKSQFVSKDPSQNSYECIIDNKWRIYVKSSQGVSLDNIIKSLFDTSISYKVNSISVIKRGDGDSIDKVTMELVSKIDSNFKVTLGGGVLYSTDLSWIDSITQDSNQSLAHNIPYEEYLSNTNKANQSYNDAVRQAIIQNNYDIDAVKGRLESESTIEVMLRSILLFAITSKTIDRSKFIQTLFSEGAYRKFFSNGVPNSQDYALQNSSAYQDYLSGKITPETRLHVNVAYGNNYQLLSGENSKSYGDGGVLTPSKNLGSELRPVDFDKLFKFVKVYYGETPKLEGVESLVKEESKYSVYIPLGLFFLILNHTGIIYTQSKSGKDEPMTPISYIDFNPNTNFYLSNINQISVDPYKFLVEYTGQSDDFKKLFDPSMLAADGSYKLKEVKPPATSTDDPNEKSAIPSSTDLFDPKQDTVSKKLTNSKAGVDGETNGYTGRLMDVLVNVNYLLDMIKSYVNASDTHEIYFQSVIDNIISDLNKSMGGINAFRLSYNDNANCYVITDDQINPAHKEVQNIHSDLIKNPINYELPIIGKSSIARSFAINTEISGRISNLIAISSNPGIPSQVAAGKDASDFGIYNAGTYDRYKNITTDYYITGSNKQVSGDNYSMFQMASNFNSVVKGIYSAYPKDEAAYFEDPQSKTFSLSQDKISKALNYYIEKMGYIKNSSPGNVHSLIIPIKANLELDGISCIHPFELFTVPEIVLPNRYSYNKLNKKVAFSIAKITHTLDANQWVTRFDSFMTLLRDKNDFNSSVQGITYDKPSSAGITSTVIPVNNSVYYRGQSQTQDTVTIQFLKDVLSGIGIPQPNDSQVKFMRIWRQAEAGNAAWNPFNTTLVTQGSLPNNNNNGRPVQNYPDRQSGLSATISTLTESRYRDLVNAIKNIKTDADIQNAMNVLSRSPWGTKFTSGYLAYQHFTNSIYQDPIISA